MSRPIQIKSKETNDISVCIPKQEIKISISPSGLMNAYPETTVVSLIEPDPDRITENVIGSFCCHVHFFSSQEAGQNWVKQNPGTYIVTLDDAYLLGQRKNEKRYPDLFKTTV